MADPSTTYDPAEVAHQASQGWADSAPTSLAQKETEQSALNDVAQQPETANSEPSIPEEKEGYCSILVRAACAHLRSVPHLTFFFALLAGKSSSEASRGKPLRVSAGAVSCVERDVCCSC